VFCVRKCKALGESGNLEYPAAATIACPPFPNPTPATCPPEKISVEEIVWRKYIVEEILWKKYCGANVDCETI
jgi:hypothetical protein